MKYDIDCFTMTILEDYMASMKIRNYSENTIRSYMSKIEFFFKTNKLPIDKIKSEDVFAWLKKNVFIKKPKTIELYIVALSRFFWFCLEENYISKFPIKKKWYPKIPKALPKALNEYEFARLRIQAEKELELDRVLLEILYSSGCRCTEIANLSINNVDFNKRTVYVLGKGHKWREVDFSIKCSLMLKNYLNTRNDNNQALFLNRKGEKIGSSGIYSRIKKIGKKCDPPIKISPHGLRHTFATRMLSKGAPLVFIANELGHKNLNKTTIYAQVPTNELISKYNKLMGRI